ncbi:MAG: hypothetical protein JHC26_08880 [Thermofilum sp.]|jgi:uncharacterized membrane protein YqjE|uniref:hypothetical protein n=1 Tax=Thermofilum sp. TaxID=1961369 RepID=UPI00258FF46A|nr:hypothetical protein [Thermofilum sp.]MCI4409192.1 hypothetical protein [Thermofilum sp.]
METWKKTLLLGSPLFVSYILVIAEMWRESIYSTTYMVTVTLVLLLTWIATIFTIYNSLENEKQEQEKKKLLVQLADN